MWVNNLRTVNYNAAECFPEMSSWCQNEQVCQGVKCKVFWTIRRTGYRMRYKYYKKKHTFTCLRLRCVGFLYVMLVMA